MESLDSLKSSLKRLGFYKDTSLLCLHPGPSREEILAFILHRLFKSASATVVVGKLHDNFQNVKSLSVEEASAQKYVHLLTLVGIVTTVDTVRGCVCEDESLAFLQRLVSIVDIKDVSTLNSSVSLTVAEDCFNLPTVPQQPSSVGDNMPVMDFICTNILKLTCEQNQVLPTDIIRATAKNLNHVEDLLSSCHQQELNLDQKIFETQETSVNFSSKMQWSGGPEKQVCQSGLAESLRGYVNAVTVFSDVYLKELGVWSKSLPAAQACSGIGPKSDSILRCYNRLSAALNDISTIRRMHTALSSAAPPLQAFQPNTLLKISKCSKEESVVLARHVHILSTAAATFNSKMSDCNHNGSGVALDSLERDAINAYMDVD
ncbi:hypothetical protein CEUSTIGMA_g1947.t1 [Chlamydomonas eustigma]|uniref:Uncharacterized protein n=1 Tax=Chlamydomonas eustigma TaxID=1157962 RepID=A0A250WUJ7_9CHLO|nr:hypothetical protein CEUSTIGMA_g1947.t1 [Chlamydomonas eustigma]|eukprot:GAX74498.1 hypothetical protein CEUSTIGMA_g1947.t1 [Chlamydomonas eustigma]